MTNPLTGIVHVSANFGTPLFSNFAVQAGEKLLHPLTGSMEKFIVSARKYRFRKRVLMVMSALMVATAALSFTVNSELWWLFGASAGVTVLYLLDEFTGQASFQFTLEAQLKRFLSLASLPISFPGK